MDYFCGSTYFVGGLTCFGQLQQLAIEATTTALRQMITFFMVLYFYGLVNGR